MPTATWQLLSNVLLQILIIENVVLLKLQTRFFSTSSWSLDPFPRLSLLTARHMPVLAFGTDNVRCVC